MDELLALMEEDINVPAPTEQPPSEDDESPPPSPPRRQQQVEQSMASSADAKVGIRMINRNISGAELMDILASNPYHSPATLSAMSLADLNRRVLVQPATVVDAATVCGRTSIVTAGLVFTNSGTRMSSTGKAFCILTIGNLATGPAISILAFGAAFSKNVQTATPGKVLLLQQPRLLPAKGSNSKDATSVSFTVNDERQLQIAADARDFGICKGKVRGKDFHTGQWVADAKRCHKYVDLRKGCFCKIHHSQGRQQQMGGGNRMDQLRSQARAFPTAVGKTPQTTMILPMKRMQQQPSRGQVQGSQHMMQLVNKASVGSSLRSSVPLQKPASTTTNSLLNPYNRSKKLAPMMKKNAPLVTPHRTPVLHRGSVSTLEGGATKRTPITADLTQQKAGRKRQRKVNIGDLSGFNGTVQVPKPSARMFAATSGNPFGVRSRGEEKRVPMQRTREDILLKQKQAAERLRGKTALMQAVHPTKATGSRKKVASRQNSSRKSEDLLFGSLGDIDRNKVLTAGSRFANEVSAEEYARARQAMAELENDEAKKEAKEARSKKTSKVLAIQKEWQCLACKRSFSVKPAKCVRLGHQVRLKRQIEQKKSTTEKRLQLSEKTVEDGGLTLGAGIEWGNGQKWSRFS